MTELPHLEPPKPKEDENGSAAKRFLSSRSLLLIKGFRLINEIRCDYGTRIVLSSAVITRMETKSTPKRTTFGLRLAKYNADNEVDGTAFVDFDEFSEVIPALQYIAATSAEMKQEQREYTEIEYITKDEITFGFFQDYGRQQFFISLGGRSGNAFTTLDGLNFLRENFEYARDFLVTKGAK